jgi:flap endonuclease-1
MGVHGLNTLFNKYCKKCVKNSNLYNYKNKTIVIDINNYLYRFLKNNTLIPSLYELCNMLKFYNITPIFVFDGFPPHEKLDKINQRREERYEAIENCERLKLEYEKTKNKKLLKQIEILTKKGMKITNKNFKEVKTLLTLLDYKYIISDGEADKLCASMVIHNEAYACLSEDNDLFVYGCPRVIRYLSLIKHTFQEYNLNILLNSLNITFEQFQDMCILSGTDYNTDSIDNNKNIHYYYNNYLNGKISISNTTNKVKNIKELFTLLKKENYEYRTFAIEKISLQEFLKDYNFIFI